MLKIDHYAYMNRLKDVHPVEKVGFALPFLLFTIVTKNIFIASITFLVMSTSIILAAKIPFLKYLQFLLLPSFFLFSSIIAILISIAPIDDEIFHAVWNIEVGAWQIYMSPASMNQAYHLTATVFASVSCLYFLILTTPLYQFIWLLQKGKLPPLFIELVGFTYRFIFVLLDKTHEIYIGQVSRLGYQHYKAWLWSIGQLIVSLFIKSIRSQRELQIAIDSRGGEDRLYEVELQLKYHPLHGIGIIFSVLSLWMIAALT